MAVEVTLPELGESVTEGTITAWLVDVGQQVEADQPLFELSSDKVDTEVPAPVRGVLQEIKVQVDETVDVGTVVAIIGEPDEAAAEARAEAPPEPEPESEPEQAPEPSGDGDAASVPMSPLVRRIVTEHDLDVAQISGSGKGGRITRDDVEAALKAPAEARSAAPRGAGQPEPGSRPTTERDERTRVED
ncbi:MAG: biotin/lipoyl-containing protein, partial [Gaiellaceae bacterium]